MRTITALDSTLPGPDHPLGDHLPRHYRYSLSRDLWHTLRALLDAYILHRH